MTAPPSALLAATLDQPEQVRRAAQVTRGQLAERGDLLPGHDDIEHVVVLGMGTSARAGDVALVVAGPLMAVPVVVHRGFALPNFVDRHTLVLAISGSGDTAETRETAGLAVEAGATVVAVTGGGDLGQLAADADLVVVGDAAVLGGPRPALANLAVPALVVLDHVGLFPGAADWIEAAAVQLAHRRDQMQAADNPAELLARRIGRLFPLIYGGGGAGAVAARHWKSQFNLNAKMPAFANEQPEVGHDEVSGFGQSGDVTRQIFRIIDLRHEFEHPQLADRFARTDDLLAEVVAGIDQVRAEGDGVLAQLLDLAFYGELVSIHRALQEGIDPGPTPALEAAAR